MYRNEDSSRAFIRRVEERARVLEKEKNNMKNFKNLFTYKFLGSKYEVYLEVSSYQNNDNLALIAKEVDGEGITPISVNIVPLPKDQFCLDTNNLSPELIDVLKKAKVFKQVGYNIQSGFCHYPVCELNQEIKGFLK